MPTTQTFNQRFELSNLLADKITQLFSNEYVEIIPFGFETISKNNNAFKNYISTAKSNLSHSTMLVKFCA